jgi:hypothetical protein
MDLAQFITSINIEKKTGINPLTLSAIRTAERRAAFNFLAEELKGADPYATFTLLAQRNPQMMRQIAVKLRGTCNDFFDWLDETAERMGENEKEK